MSPVIPQVPALSEAVSRLFADFQAILNHLRAQAEAAFPGSGKVFDAADQDLAALRATTDVPAIAAAFLTQMGSAMSTGQAPIVHDTPTDLAG